MRRNHVLLGCAVVVLAAQAQPAHSDPCGMVPPAIMIEGDPIVRIGAQKTYVFYKNDIETLVLRPGFKGKVDEFGMLIPFPSPPEIRKVDDNIFPHIAAAIDPPEVMAWVQRRWRRRPMSKSARGAPSAMADSAAEDEAGLGYNEVRVVRQEAVGMYDVAVLEAGSAEALKKWMDSNGFRYPDGMDDPVNDYVAARWAFVAVKTQVGQKKGVNPRPGMRKADAKLPPGSTFDGHVQAMGFRFETKELVVPMRLSAFNPGKLRNIVYILTDKPQRIDRIPNRFVVRQISGKELYRNVTGPLPLRVIGGTYADLNQWQKDNLKNQRDPKPHNGLAKTLFASDLLAVRKGRLSNPFEDKEKDLLAIGERLGLRGLHIDNLHAAELDKERDKATKVALRGLKGMTLTIVDGEFRRETIAEDNLAFAAHRMPKARNNKQSYDARRMGPGVAPPNGKLYRGSLEPGLRNQPGTNPWVPAGVSFGLLAAFGGLLLVRRRGRAGYRGAGIGLVLIVVIGAAATAVAGPKSRRSGTDGLIQGLADADTRGVAMKALVAKGVRVLDPLLDEIVDGDDLVVKGWAIVALAEIGGPEVDAELSSLHSDARQPMLVRTWAAAARIDMATDVDGVMKLSNLASMFPALSRPIGLKLAALLSGAKGVTGAEQMFDAMARVPGMQKELAPVVMGLGVDTLVDTMMSSRNVNTRRMAASYLAAVDQKSGGAARAVAKRLRFERGAKTVPWDGGALFLPGLSYAQNDARAIADSLVRWHLWADIQGQQQLQQQIHNNLRTGQLASSAGYNNPRWNDASTVNWLRVWGSVVGRRGIRKILREQGVLDDPKYKLALTGIVQPVKK